MPRRILRTVPDLPPSPPPDKPDKPVRYISRCSRTVFKERRGQQKAWLTIGQLQKAFLGAHRVRLLGLLVTRTDLDILNFVFTCGAPQGGPHSWRVLGTPMTLVQSMSRATHFDPAEIRRSLRRLQKEGLLEVVEQEVWTTHQLHRVGAELLWCDLLRRACPKDFDFKLIDWFTVTRDVDRVFRTENLDPTRAADRRAVMMQIIQDVQRRCK